MGYFKDDKFMEVLRNIDIELECAMKSLSQEGGLINKWAFDSNGDVVLFQEFPCGCNKSVGKIQLDIKREELDVIKEEEFVMQVEDILLEVNFSKAYDNLLFNVKDINTIRTFCEKCENL